MLDIRLFGRFEALVGSTPAPGFESSKEVELLCYLLSNKEKYQSREKLASLLWGGSSTTAQAKSYLRKSLWKLQHDLNAAVDWEGGLPIEADSDWIILRRSGQLVTDVDRLEDAYVKTRGSSGETISDDQREAMRVAVSLYRDDYLTDWYFEWCIFERHRLQHIYLYMLDKLMEDAYCTGCYEDGLQFGMYILRVDEAREVTHRRMMMIYARLGDRTGALRQYQWCVRVLKSELDIAPSSATDNLFVDVRDNKLEDLLQSGPAFQSDGQRVISTKSLKPRLLNLQTSLTKAQEEVRSTLTGIGA